MQTTSGRGAVGSAVLWAGPHSTLKCCFSFFLFFINQHVQQQLFIVAVPRLRCQAGSPKHPKFPSMMSFLQGVQKSSAVPISRGSVSGPPTQPQCHPTPQQPSTQVLTLLLPPSPLCPYAEGLVGEQNPLPQVRTEKSPSVQHETSFFFNLGIRKLEHGRDFSL